MLATAGVVWPVTSTRHSANGRVRAGATDDDGDDGDDDDTLC
jgi:hypothetical protein